MGNGTTQGQPTQQQLDTLHQLSTPGLDPTQQQSLYARLQQMPGMTFTPAQSAADATTSGPALASASSSGGVGIGQMPPMPIAAQNNNPASRPQVPSWLQNLNTSAPPPPGTMKQVGNDWQWVPGQQTQMQPQQGMMPSMNPNANMANPTAGGFVLQNGQLVRPWLPSGPSPADQAKLDAQQAIAQLGLAQGSEGPM